MIFIWFYSSSTKRFLLIFRQGSVQLKRNNFIWIGKGSSASISNWNRPSWRGMMTHDDSPHISFFEKHGLLFEEFSRKLQCNFTTSVHVKSLTDFSQSLLVQSFKSSLANMYCLVIPDQDVKMPLSGLVFSGLLVGRNAALPAWLRAPGLHV